MTTIYIDLPLKYAKLVAAEMKKDAAEMKKDAAKLIEANKFKELNDLLIELEYLTNRINDADKEEK